MCSILLTVSSLRRKNSFDSVMSKRHRSVKQNSKVWAAGEDISNLSILLASFGWVMFWPLRKSEGFCRVLGGWQREDRNAGNFSTLFLGYLIVLTGIANWLFLTFQKNEKRLLWEGSGGTVSGRGGWIHVWKEGELWVCFSLPYLQPPLPYFIAYTWVRITTSYLKMGHLLQDLFLP